MVAVKVGELRQLTGHFIRRPIAVPAQAKIQGEPGTNLPVILDEEVAIFHRVVAVRIGVRAGVGIDGRLHEIGKIILEVAIDRV